MPVISCTSMLSRLTVLMQVTKDMVVCLSMLSGEMVPAALCMHHLALLQRCCMHMSFACMLGCCAMGGIVICVDHHWSFSLSIGVCDILA
jgi:hypothetical protein